MTLPERDVHLMLEEPAALGGRVLKLIRVKELVAPHKPEQMRRVRMLEKQVAWKREDGVDRIEVIAERHEKSLGRLYAGFDSDPVYTGVHYGA